MNNDANIQAVLSLKDEMSGGLAKVQQAVAGVQQEFRTAGQQINKSMSSATAGVQQAGRQISQQLEGIDKGNVRAAASFSRLSARLIGLNGITQALNSVGSEMGGARKAISAASNGLMVFGSAATLATGPVGLTVAAVLGLGSALATLGQESDEAKKKLEEFAERSKKLAQALRELKEAPARLGEKLNLLGAGQSEREKAKLDLLLDQVSRAADFKRESDTLFRDLLDDAMKMFDGATDVAALQGWLEKFERGEYAQLLNEITRAEARLVEAVEKGKPLGGLSEEAVNKVKRLAEALKSAQAAAELLADPQKAIANQRTLAEFARASDEVQKLQNGLQDLVRISEQKVQFGLSDALTESKVQAEAAKKVAEQLLVIAQDLGRFLDKLPSKVDEGPRKALEGLLQSLQRSTLGSALSFSRDKESDRRTKEELDRQQREWAALQDKMKEFDLSVGIERAVTEWSKSFRTLKDVALDAFAVIEHSMSDMFTTLMSSSRKWRDGLKNVFKDVAQSFKRMLADFFAQSIMRSGLASLFPASFMSVGAGPGNPGGAPGMPGLSMTNTGVSPLGAAMGLGSLAQLTAPAGGGGALSGLFGGPGAFGLGAGGSALLGVGGLAMASQAKDPISGALSGGLGAGLLGASLFAGPAAPLIMGLGGLLFGGLMGSKAKEEAEKAKEEQEAAAQEAAERLEEQRKAAANIIKTSVKAQLGGGLATPEAAASVGALFSGDISAEEIDSFGGVEAVLARGAQVAGMANAGAGSYTDVGGVTINVKVDNLATSYDVQKLAEDLGYYVQNSFGG